MGLPFSTEHWTTDHSRTSCEHCLAPFTATKRRHHCRDCGRLLCDNCSSSMGPIPSIGLRAPARECVTCFNRNLDVVQASCQCPRGHWLEHTRWIFRSFRCNKCHHFFPKYSGYPRYSWRCAMCDYDVCPLCASRDWNHAVAQKVEEKFGVSMLCHCRRGHRLTHVQFDSCWRCNECRYVYLPLANAYSWSCLECHYDMCDRCAVKIGHLSVPMPEQPQSPRPETDSESHDSQLPRILGSGEIDSTACVVCLEQAKSHVIYPCGHKCVCGSCGQNGLLRACPVCRGRIEKCFRVYE